MGLEAETTCTHSGKSFAVKALLESTELILRGELKRKLPIAALKYVSIKNTTLTFEAEGEHYALALGAAKSAAWAKKIAMPPPLTNGAVTFADGTPNTLDQEARDVVTFLTWASEPKMEERKRMGFNVMIFLFVLAGLLYLSYRSIWRDAH